MKLLKFTKEFLADPENQQILLLFVTWRIWLFVFALLGLVLLPMFSKHFFGGGLEKYVQNPLFWTWANFDGEHYLSIAQYGYKPLQHSFFPIYPFLIKFVSSGSLRSLTVSGLVISNLAILASLFLLWRLVRLDYSSEVATWTLVSLLAFPTSFFFGSVYTSSLFLLLTLGSFLAARKARWVAAGLLGAVASATRIFGIFLLPALLVELWQQAKEKEKLLARGNVAAALSPFAENSERKFGDECESHSASKGLSSLRSEGTRHPERKLAGALSLLVIPLGFLAYLFFLHQTTGSSLNFYSELSTFGEQRGSRAILLPQVFWRYIKIILSVQVFSPLYLTIMVEFIVAAGSLLLIFWLLANKGRFSYVIFATLGYILPTLTGSFSSLPRYVLVLFPLYIGLGLTLSRVHRTWKVTVLLVFLTLLAVETMLFARGYWVG